MKLFLIVLIGLVLEVFVWIGVGDLVGSMWYVFFWFVAAFFIGLNLIRKYSAGVMPQMQQMQMGQIGADPALSNNLPKIFCGFFIDDSRINQRCFGIAGDDSCSYKMPLKRQ